jgi:hypothetical protein
MPMTQKFLARIRIDHVTTHEIMISNNLKFHVQTGKAASNAKKNTWNAKERFRGVYM